jgi:hypothetical protein
MVWGRRRFQYAEYKPYFERLEQLLLSHPSQYREFMMVGVNTDAPGTTEIFVGVPSATLLAAFDGFDPLEESELPKVIDTVHIADTTKVEFKSRFSFRHSQRSNP